MKRVAVTLLVVSDWTFLAERKRIMLLSVVGVYLDVGACDPPGELYQSSRVR